MSKTAKLAGVAHSIAHHAGSGVSWISPHLAEALRAVGASTTDIDLLAFSPYPPEAAELKPLRLGLRALKAKSKSILLKHGFSDTDVASIVLRATPASWDKGGYSLHTRAVVTSRSGRVYDSGWLQ